MHVHVEIECKMQKVVVESAYEARALAALRAMTLEQKKYAIAGLVAAAFAFPRTPYLRLVANNGD